MKIIVRVLDDLKQYLGFKEVGECFETQELKFKGDIEVTNKETLTLIKYIVHPFYSNKELAICYNQDNFIIIIDKDGIKELYEMFDIGTEVVDNKGNYLGKIVKSKLGYNNGIYSIKTNGGILLKFGDEINIRKTEDKKVLLPIGTQIELIKPIFGFEDSIKVGTIFRVTNSNENRAVIESNNMVLGINSCSLENEFKVLKQTWSRWIKLYDTEYNKYLFYRKKGNKIEVKVDGYKGYSSCSDQDKYDFVKGLRIALLRGLMLKQIDETEKLRKKLKELCE